MTFHGTYESTKYRQVLNEYIYILTNAKELEARRMRKKLQHQNEAP